MKTCVIDTNVFMRNAFALYILSGNKIPDEEAKRQFDKNIEDLISEGITTKEEIFTPKDVLIPDISLRELDHLKDDQSNPHRASLARKAISIIDDLLEEYQDPTEDTSANAWKTYGDGYIEIILPNKAKIIFAEHNELSFTQTNIPYSNNDDRIIFQTLNAISANPFVEYILITSDKGLERKARQKGINVSDFDYDSIKDLSQLPDGYVKYKTPKVWKNNVASKEKITTTLDEVENVLSMVPVNNQTIWFSDNNDETFVYIVKIDDDDITLKPIKSKDKLKELHEHFCFSEKEKIDIKSGLDYVQDRLKTMLYEAPKEEHLTDRFKKIEDTIYSIDPQRLKQNSIDHLRNRIHNYIQEIRKRKNSFSSSNRTNACLKNINFNTEIVPRNLEQESYLELLLDPTIKVITASGAAGTGKTLLAMLSGIMGLLDGTYKSIRYTKPLITSDDGFGFLPGDKDKKMQPFSTPAIKSLQTLFNHENLDEKYDSIVDAAIGSLKMKNLIGYEPISFDAGNTWKNKYVIIDESQLFTLDQVKLLIGRVGENSKVVFLGDPDQISTSAGRKYSYITERNSGFNHLIEKLQGSRIYGHIALQDVLRSDVAKLTRRLF